MAHRCTRILADGFCGPPSRVASAEVEMPQAASTTTCCEHDLVVGLYFLNAVAVGRRPLGAAQHCAPILRLFGKARVPAFELRPPGGEQDVRLPALRHARSARVFRLPPLFVALNDRDALGVVGQDARREKPGDTPAQDHGGVQLNRGLARRTYVVEPLEDSSG
jgi:hypothetical protein